MKFRTALAGLAALAFVPSVALAGPVSIFAYDEAVDGDLSDDQFNPTFLALGLGSNLVAGLTEGNPNLDRDFLTVEVAAGMTLEAVVLERYDTTSINSFIAVEAGEQISSLSDVSTFLGATLIGSEAGVMEGDNFLDDLAFAPLFGGLGFGGTLGEGRYTFWFQETLDPVDYVFDFQVVPAPAGAGLLAAAGLLARRRRR